MNTKERKNLWLNATILQRFLNSWVLPLIILGNKRDLEEKDLCDCVPEYQAKNVGEDLEKEWQIELNKNSKKKSYNPSLLKAILKANKSHVLTYISLTFLQNCILRVVQPILLGEIVRFFNEDKSESFIGLNLNIASCLTILWLTSIIFSYLGNAILGGGSEVGIRVRIGCSYLLYKKAMRLSTSALGDTQIGQIVNMMSNNFNRFELTGRFMPYAFSSPVHLLITAIILWKMMGPSTIAGSLVFVFQLLFQIAMGKAIAIFRFRTSKITDERVRILNESVSAIKSIKMYTLENIKTREVEEARKKEISKQLLQSTLQGLASDISHLFGKLALFVTILVFYLVNHMTVTPFNLFIAMSFFENLRFSFRLFSFGIYYIAESLSNIRRFQDFLLLEEKGSLPICNQEQLSTTNSESKEAVIYMRNLNAKWSLKNTVPAVTDISISVKEGELVAIVGPVGSGKTSLLQCLMGELQIVSGQIQVNGTTAYVPQEAWLHTGTIRDNILLFSDIEETLYSQILQVCTLNRDIAMMESGDRTMVGERGALLSGGQKARVNLARALCSKSEIYLLDDPLSAVDALVGRKIFDNCIKRFLSGTTRVLVTHQVQYLKEVDRVIVLKNGKCIAQGTYEELTQQGIELEKLVKKDDEESVPTPTRAMSGAIVVRKASVVNTNEMGNTDNIISEVLTLEESLDEKPERSEQDTFTKGTTMKSLWKYLKEGGGIPAILLILFFAVLAQVSFNLTDIYLSLWSSARKCPVAHRDNQTAAENMINTDCISFLKTKDSYFYGYITIILCLLTFWVGRSVVFYTMANHAAKNMHVKVIRRLFYAPMAFFESNPSGRILNRVTKDMGNIDDVLPYILCEALMVSMLELGFLAVIVYYYIIMIIPSALLITACVIMGYFYIKPSRDIQKLDSSCSSPVYSHLSSSIQGLQTIRSYRGESMFQDKFCNLLDVQTTASIINNTSGSFYRTGIEFGSIIFLTCIHIMIYFSPNSTASAAGLALSACLQIAMALQYVALLVLNCVSLLVSVERFMEYKKLPYEQLYKDDSNLKYNSKLGRLLKRKTHDTEDNISKETNWPTEGAIRFQNVSLYYDHSKPPSLNNINFEIKPKETIGIVGRTGAGKSSIVSALLRLTEPDGLIFIDDVPTKDISLGQLRSKISVIPQDPVLFSGPLRLSIDPYSKWPDFKLWKALKQVQLDTTIGQLKDGLDTILTDGGSNFSVGQRQLLCLARTILLNNKILVLDEATANIDPRTDSIIQQSIKDNLHNCTTLTVAHRLDTIIDCDRVMVLDKGELVEYDEPYNLLQDYKSAFSSLISQTGRNTCDYLNQKAKQAHLKRVCSNLGTKKIIRSLLEPLDENLNDNPNKETE